MKKEIKKTKVFDIASFETLDSNGITLLKGGFSLAYNEKSTFGGTAKEKGTTIVNDIAGCGCTINNNNVAGCACSK